MTVRRTVVGGLLDGISSWLQERRDLRLGVAGTRCFGGRGTLVLLRRPGTGAAGLPEAVVAYYTEHVEADAVHEQLAVRSICAPLVAADPTMAEDVFFGAFSCLDLEDRLAARLLDAWDAA